MPKVLANKSENASTSATKGKLESWYDGSGRAAMKVMMLTGIVALRK